MWLKNYRIASGKYQDVLRLGLDFIKGIISCSNLLSLHWSAIVKEGSYVPCINIGPPVSQTKELPELALIQSHMVFMSTPALLPTMNTSPMAKLWTHVSMLLSTWKVLKRSQFVILECVKSKIIFKRKPKFMKESEKQRGIFIVDHIP